jgi:hypothetical protein
MSKPSSIMDSVGSYYFLDPIIPALPALPSATELNDAVHNGSSIWSSFRALAQKLNPRIYADEEGRKSIAEICWRSRLA